MSLGFPLQATDSRSQPTQLAGCSHDELASILSAIQAVFPAVNVLFELGRAGTSFAQGRLEAYRLSDIRNHTRLESTEQVVACLTIIDEALHRIRGSADASFYGVRGDCCFVATETQQNIQQLWFELIGHGTIASAPTAAASGDGSGLGAPQPESNPLPASPSPGVGSSPA